MKYLVTTEVVSTAAGQERARNKSSAPCRFYRLTMSSYATFDGVAKSPISCVADFFQELDILYVLPSP
jgi:hypothetical protein